MIVVYAVEDTHVDFVGILPIIVDFGRGFSPAVRVLLIDHTLADGKQVGRYATTQLRELSADDILIKDDHRLLKAVDSVFFIGHQAAGSIGHKRLSVPTVQLVYQLVFAGLDTIKQVAVI